MPELPVPELDPNDPFCTPGPDSGPGDLSSHTSFKHLDSSLAFATHLPEEPTLGPKLNSPHLAEEHKFIVPDGHQVGVQEPMLSVDEFVSSINTEVLRIIFLVLDAVLLVYRFTHTYIKATTMCTGFEDTREEKLTSSPHQHMYQSHKTDTALTTPDSSYRSHDHIHHQIPADERTVCSEHSTLHDDPSYLNESTIPDYNASPWQQDPAATYESQNPTSQSHPHHHSNAIPPSVLHTDSSKDDPPQNCMHERYIHAKQVFGRLLLSDSVPKFLIACAFMVLFYILVKASFVLVDFVSLSQLEGFSMFSQALDVQINQTNWYLSDQAKHFNKVTMKIYEEQMKSELLNLESMLEYFNSGQCSTLDFPKTESSFIITPLSLQSKKD